MVKGLVVKIIIGLTMALSGGVGTVALLSQTGQVELTSPAKTYTCTFVNYDGSMLYQCAVEPSHTAVYRGDAPVREADQYHSYAFTGWDYPLANVMRDMTFTAQFREIGKLYHVSFLNYNGNLLYDTEVEVGQNVSYPYGKPTRPSDERFSYAFVGWDHDIDAPIVEDTVFTAQFEASDQLYRVYFYDYDETLLYDTKVPFGANANYEGPALKGPTPEPGYSYTFKGWSSSVANITKDTAVIATYDKKRLEYTVTYYNYDETTLYVDHVYYGESSVYLGEEPYRPNDEEHSYTFIGWDKSQQNIQSDQAIYALYSTEEPNFTVTFRNYDGEVLETAIVPIGENAVYSGEEPVKPATEKYTYKFVGWDRDLTAVKASFSAYAQFEEVPIEFDVTFYDDRGNELSAVSVPYGENGEEYYDGPIPTKEEDDLYTYTFKEWDVDLSSIVEDTETYAVFEPHVKELPTGEEDEGQGGPNEGGEGGGGGGGGLGPMSGPAIVKFCNYDSKELDVDAVVPGANAVYDRDLPLPTRPASKKYKNYEFVGWDRPLENVTQSFTTYAQYKITDDFFDQYILTFRNDNGELLFESVFGENEVPKYPETFVPESGIYKVAVFTGWDRQITRSDSSYTVYATYQPAFSGSDGGSGGGDMEGGDMEGGSGGGGDTSGGMGFPDPNAEADPIASGTTNYSGHFYLRERSYGDVKNNVWQEATPYQGLTAYSPSTLVSDIISQKPAVFKPFDISVTYEHVHRYQPIPMYGLSEVKNANDVYVPGVASKQIDYTFSPFELSQGKCNILETLGHSSRGVSAMEVNYRQYVHENYLNVNENQETFLKNFVQENDLSVDSIADIINVKDFLKNYATYNMEAEPYPADSDYVVYFLESAKEGVCNHFASALVGIYRTLGLPARFVTGYSVSAYGGTFNVTSKEAHAWTEIYLDGIGWITVDATPGYSDGSGEIDEGALWNQGSYNPFGEVIGEPLLTITFTPETTSKEYDGTPIKVEGSYEGEFLNDGDSIRYDIQESSGIGTFVTRACPRIISKEGKDVSSQYENCVAIVNNTFTIKQRRLVIETGSASKTRDGKPLTCNTYEILEDTSVLPQHTLKVVLDGKQIDPGVSSNTVKKLEILDEEGNDVRNYYAIEVRYGTLTVK